ncbi:hypothetical protein [Alteromonas sp. AMM-1]|uniref:hypothetical protein n=1 Tax=Alteromonas sp. AMM-1 TaxID=3394233 RepID=UPI0039A4FC50
MKAYNVTPEDWFKGTALFFALFVIFQLGALLGQTAARLYAEHETIDRLQSRISLDLQFLDVGNSTLNTPPNQYTLKDYLARLNATLSNPDTGIALVSIQSVSADNTSANFDNARLTPITLQNSEQTVQIQIASLPLYRYLAFSPLAFFAAALLVPVLMNIKPARKIIKPEPLPQQLPEIAPEPKLVINLNDKTIGNGVNAVTVQLQNKPLCFYTALLHYCIDNPDAMLLHHKDIPPELTAQANKAFGRLMDLGHTKRKRPDFNANLDKTLSEIRAALDEVFAGYSEEKSKYYPPRAQGEGSRSKQHSYAMSGLVSSDIVIIGD